MRERDRGRLGVIELYSKGTRVSRLTPLSGRVLTEYWSENHDKTETLLAFGASRFEACRPLAIESLRLALMPTINQMR